MPNYSRISILGHAGKAAAIEGDGDKRRAKFSLAVNEGRDRNGQEIPSSWYYVTAWGKAASRAEGIRAGDLVQVNGRSRMEQYTSKDGDKRVELRITAERVINFSDWQRGKEEQSPDATVPPRAQAYDEVPF
jgi:single-stranded DNA-binding protein